MRERGQEMVAFLGVKADRRLWDEDRFNLPSTVRRPGLPVSTRKHERLVTAGTVLTAVTLIGGIALTVFGIVELLFSGGGILDAAVALIGLLLAATHWGWVHVAEYVGLTIDDRDQRAAEQVVQDWLAKIEPFPRFSVSTQVLDDASTQVERVLHEPVLTPQHTFTFVRETEATVVYDADVPTEVIAATVETMRHQARTETDRLRELWEAASAAYTAALQSSEDDRQQLAARHAAATALSEHINASLLEPPVIE